MERQFHHHPPNQQELETPTTLRRLKNGTVMRRLPAHLRQLLLVDGPTIAINLNLPPLLRIKNG